MKELGIGSFIQLISSPDPANAEFVGSCGIVKSFVPKECGYTCDHVWVKFRFQRNTTALYCPPDEIKVITKRAYLRSIALGPRNEEEVTIFAEEAFRVDVQQLLHETMLRRFTKKEIKAFQKTEKFGKVFDSNWNPSIREVARIFKQLGETCIISVK